MAVALRSSSVTGTGDTNGASCVVPVPTGAASGDIAILAMEHWDTFDGTSVTFPAGFTTVINGILSGNREKLYVAWKRLTGADTGNYTVTWTGNQWNMGHCLMVSGVVGSGDPVDVSTSGTTVSVTTLPTMLITTTVANTFVAHFIANQTSASGTPPTGFTEIQDGNYLRSNYLIRAATGSLSTSGGSTSVSSPKSGAMIAFAPNTGTGGPVTLDAVGSAAAGATGSASADRPIAASGSAAAGFTGLAGAARPIAGQGTAAAHFTGTATFARGYASSGGAASSAGGTADVARGLASNAGSSAAATGAMSVARGMGASSPAASSFTGALVGGGQKDFDGSAAAAAGFSGDFALARDLAGFGDSASSASADVSLDLGLAGVIAAASDALGDLVLAVQFWRLVMPQIIERRTLQGLLSTTLAHEKTVFGDEDGLFTVERGSPSPGTDSYGAIPFGTKYIWYGGHVNVTDDPAIKNLWLAHGFEVENVPVP